MRWTTTRISITLWCSWIWTMSIVQGSLLCAQQREPTLADFEEVCLQAACTRGVHSNTLRCCFQNRAEWILTSWRSFSWQIVHVSVSQNMIQQPSTIW
ncbi:MAG: hypothetical protein J3Q66DRAFT_337591 [Benniella sp.]|nr:MAG: hypothetical protein J3Q66DRAFT_337591 [Benniella sp.]